MKSNYTTQVNPVVLGLLQPIPKDFMISPWFSTAGFQKMQSA